MARIVVETHLPASPDAVWAEVSRLESHVEWMVDAVSVEFLSSTHRGLGTRMRVATRVGPFSTSDVMEVTAWEPPELIAVSHQGLFTGEGRFVLAPLDRGTRFRWEEDVRFPWYLGGPIGAGLARPALAATWRRNLRRLRARFG